MKEQSKTFRARPITIRIWTLRDKDSMFRAKNPDQHIVEIRAEHTIIREFVFTDSKLALAHYRHLKGMFK